MTYPFLLPFGVAFPAPYRTQPDIFMHGELTKVPAELGTLAVDWAFRPLADPGVFREGRILDMSEISRRPSDDNGNMQFDPVTVELADYDGFFRQRLAAGSPTEYFLNREFTIMMLSPEGREAGLDPVWLGRFLVSNIQPVPRRRVRLELKSALATLMSGPYRDEKLGTLIGDEHGPTLPDTSRGQAYPYLLGEGSDIGAADEAGGPADVGVVPVIEGHAASIPEELDPVYDDPFIAGNVAPGDAWTPETVSTMNPPVITDAATFGVPGTITRHYQMTAVNDQGETTPSNVFSVENTNDPLIPATRGVDLDFTCDAGATKINLYGDRFNPPTHLIATLPLEEGQTSGTFRHDGSTEAQAVTPPAINRAVVDLEGWTWMIAAEGALTGIPAVYGSDRAENDAPKRIRQGLEWFGAAGELLAFGYADWPHTNGYITVDGVKQSGIYARGVILDHHRRGIVTITVNYCGQDADGTGTGLVVDGAMPMLQKVLGDLAFPGGGFYANGDPFIDSPAFQLWQDRTKDWMGDDTGYTGNVAITEPIALREFLRRWLESFGGHLAETRRGQIRPFWVDPDHVPDLEDAFRARYFNEVHALIDQSLDWDEIKTREEYSYAWSPSADDFLVKGVVVEDLDAQAALVPNADPEDPDVAGKLTKTRDMYYVNDAEVAASVNERDLALRTHRTEYAVLMGDLRLTQIDIGDYLYWAHYDRVASNASGSYVPTDEANLSPAQVWAQAILPKTKEVRLTVRDLSALVPGGSP